MKKLFLCYESALQGYLSGKYSANELSFALFYLPAGLCKKDEEGVDEFRQAMAQGTKKHVQTAEVHRFIDTALEQGRAIFYDYQVAQKETKNPDIVTRRIREGANQRVVMVAQDSRTVVNHRTNQAIANLLKVNGIQVNLDDLIGKPFDIVEIGKRVDGKLEVISGL